MREQSQTIFLGILIKTFLIGMLIAELVILIQITSRHFFDLSISNDKEYWILIILILYLIILCCVRKAILKRVLFLIKSLRIDLLIILAFGVVTTYFFNEIATNIYQNIIKSLSWAQITTIMVIPDIIFISIILNKLQNVFSVKQDTESLFMSDKEGKNRNEDGFNFTDKAEKLAEQIFNQGSSESLVFGIDAPWGTGKSTFVNLCKEYWNENHKNEMIIYTFDPLRYENKENLLQIFIDGLIKEIEIHIFAPEIDNLVSKYSRLLKNLKPSFSFMGVSLELPIATESMDRIFLKLENALSNIDKKIVIIVDDLDRVNLSFVKEVLFVIKKAFTLPNISYVLCYDTENIKAFESTNNDSEKIAEFLEKFINVKINIFLDSKLLLDYFIENKDKSRSKNLFANLRISATSGHRFRKHPDSISE